MFTSQRTWKESLTMGAFTWSLSDIPLGTEDNSVYETSSCFKTKKSFAWYRFIQSGYFLAWFLMILITTNHANHWVYLTNWGEALLTTYFVLANITNICFQTEGKIHLFSPVSAIFSF